MGLTFRISALYTPTGLLKILETITVLLCLILLRFVFTHEYIFNNVDLTFLGIGATVGYSIIVPAIIVTYLLGASLSILELVINLIGAIIYLVLGSLTVQNYSRCRGSSCSDGIAIGSLCIIAGILFIIDFLLTMKHTTFTVIRV